MMPLPSPMRTSYLEAPRGKEEKENREEREKREKWKDRRDTKEREREREREPCGGLAEGKAPFMPHNSLPILRYRGARTVVRKEGRKEGRRRDAVGGANRGWEYRGKISSRRRRRLRRRRHTTTRSGSRRRSQASVGNSFVALAANVTTHGPTALQSIREHQGCSSSPSRQQL